MKIIGKINIVGVEYTLFLYEEIEEFKKLQEDSKERTERYLGKPEELALDGYCDYFTKEIRVYRDAKMHPAYFRMTLRHEIAHAFLFEIGNSNCDDEDLIDKISKWTPTINACFLEGMKLLDSQDGEQEC